MKGGICRERRVEKIRVWYGNVAQSYLLVPSGRLVDHIAEVAEVAIFDTLEQLSVRTLQMKRKRIVKENQINETTDYARVGLTLCCLQVTTVLVSSTDGITA